MCHKQELARPEASPMSISHRAAGAPSFSLLSLPLCSSNRRRISPPPIHHHPISLAHSLACSLCSHLTHLHHLAMTQSTAPPWPPRAPHRGQDIPELLSPSQSLFQLHLDLVMLTDLSFQSLSCKSRWNATSPSSSCHRARPHHRQPRPCRPRLNHLVEHARGEPLKLTTPANLTLMCCSHRNVSHCHALSRCSTMAMGELTVNLSSLN
jgi:hypothetical protein